MKRRFLRFLESLIPDEKKPVWSYQLVDETRVFRFRGACPYCHGALTYSVTGWVQDHNGLWMADCVESECSNEPDDWHSERWDTWLASHYNSPYVFQMPVDIAVKQSINTYYRFILS